MWCIEASQGRNNTGTSPPWVSTSLDRAINIGTESQISSLAEPTLADTHLDLTSVLLLLFLTNTLRHPHGESKHQECQARSNGIFPP